MTITADLHPDTQVHNNGPLMGAMMSRPDITKLYMSVSCPELKAESVISSDDESDVDRFEPLETHVEGDAALSMDPIEDEDICLPQVDLPTEPAKAELTQPTVVRPSLQQSVSSISSSSGGSVASDQSSRRKLQWRFKGLTLWLELEEFDSDLTRALEDLSAKHSSPVIPKSHTTAIYGMEHLSVDEARRRLASVRTRIPQWPAFQRPTGVTSDIAVCGRPGQVCSIAWSELTLATSPEHEDALDELYGLFYSGTGGGGDDGTGDARQTPAPPVRHRPWKPHNSIAYDNPETNALSLIDTVVYASGHPTLLERGRRVEAISLWSTEGKMEEWECLDRVRFW